MPDFLDSVRFEMVSVHLVSLVLLPSVENSCLQGVAVD